MIILGTAFCDYVEKVFEHMLPSHDQQGLESNIANHRLKVYRQKPLSDNVEVRVGAVSPCDHTVDRASVEVTENGKCGCSHTMLWFK